MTSPCSIEGCDKPAQGAVGQGPLAQHWGSRKASWRWCQHRVPGASRALQLEGREGGEDYCLSPVGGAGPSLGGRQAWGGEVTGQTQGTSARTTDRRALQAPDAEACSSAARTCSSRRGLARPRAAGSRGTGTVRPARPAWLLVAVGPDAADRKGWREGSCDGPTQAPNRPRECLRR